jgi:hypothetical protein
LLRQLHQLGAWDPHLDGQYNPGTAKAQALRIWPKPRYFPAFTALPTAPHIYQTMFAPFRAAFEQLK